MSGKWKFLIKNFPLIPSRALLVSYPFHWTPPTDPPSLLTRCYFIVTEFTFSTPQEDISENQLRAMCLPKSVTLFEYE